LSSDEHIFEVREHSYAAGCETFARIRARNESLPPGEKIQAVVCLSDTLAETIMTCARQAGVRIAVTGYDNLAMADLHGITTVDQKARQVGALAFQHVYNALDYRDRMGELLPQKDETIGMQTVIRTSCGC
jgi:DNA-binding LacI/PurR family transcriptional regulator